MGNAHADEIEGRTAMETVFIVCIVLFAIALFIAPTMAGK